MDSKTAVMTRDYGGSSNMSDIPLSSSVECLREGSRMDGTVKLKPKKNDSLPRLFRRKKTDPSEYCMSNKEELKPDSSRSNSLGRRIQYRISQMRNPPGSPVESLQTGTPTETKKSSIRSAISGYWSSIFKKTPRDTGEIAAPIQVSEGPTIGGTAVESQPVTPKELISVKKDVIPVKKERTEVPKVSKDDSEELEKAVKSTTQEVYVG